MERRGRSACFNFPHRLTRDAAYEALLGVNRRALHSAAADALAARHVPGTPGELAALQRLQQHYESAERWGEAHAQACAVLNQRVDQGLTAQWEELAAHAAMLWQRARRADPALAEQSAALACARAVYLAWTGHVQEAEASAAQALELARIAGDALLEARALNLLGNAAFLSSQWDNALGYYRQALAVYRAAGDQLGELRQLNNLGAALDQVGQAQEARELMARGLALARGLGHRRYAAALALNMGRYLTKSGELAAAREHLQWSLAASESDIASQSIALGSLAELALQAGEFAQARGDYRQAARLAREAGSPHFEASWLAGQSKAEQALGLLDPARRSIAAALELAPHAGDPVQHAKWLRQAQELAETAGR